MKTRKILVMFAALLPSIAFAQLKVESSGKVCIGEHIAPLSQFSALNIKTSNLCGVHVAMTANSAGSTGVASVVSDIVYGNCKALAGVYYGTAYGAAIYGSTSGMNYSLTGKYAGFFDGNVKVTGTIDGTLVNSSDARLKENVQALDERLCSKGSSILEQLDMLIPVSFNYKKIEATKNETMSEDGEEEIEEAPNPVMEKEHFGLIAQELQKVYPNLVYEKDNGYLAVNYVELVPVLMQAIKELNAKVEELSGNASASRTPFLREGGGRGGSDEITSTTYLAIDEAASMNQNVPNPFTEKTDIAIYLPETVQTATLYIYDLSGKQLEQHPITGRGDTVMTIHADKMEAGMYVYSLVADQKVVTTKKMIVTK